MSTSPSTPYCLYISEYRQIRIRAAHYIPCICRRTTILKQAITTWTTQEYKTNTNVVPRTLSSWQRFVEQDPMDRKRSEQVWDGVPSCHRTMKTQLSRYRLWTYLTCITKTSTSAKSLQKPCAMHAQLLAFSTRRTTASLKRKSNLSLRPQSASSTMYHLKRRWSWIPRSTNTTGDTTR